MMHINFKLHATALQLHDWTRKEKMKLKEQAVVEMSKKKEAQEQDSCREKEPSPAEAGVNETVEFEGEMDNFQTPLLSSLVPLNMQDVLHV
jgi:hypothetical protein